MASCPATPLTCKIASERHEREQAFRLIHEAYTRAGLIEPNPFRMRATPYHFLKSTELFVATNGDAIACTVSLVGDGALGIPMDSIYNDEVDNLRAANKRFMEVSCLADRRAEFDRTLALFIDLTRLMAQYARFHSVDMLLIAVHPRHARFYKRFLGFEQFGEERAYPTVRNRPAVACKLDFAHIDHHRPTCYEQYFGNPIAIEQLASHPMTEDDSLYFSPVIDYGIGSTRSGADAVFQ